MTRNSSNSSPSDTAGPTDLRVRSGEGVGSIVRELNSRTTQQAQQPQPTDSGPTELSALDTTDPTE